MSEIDMLKAKIAEAEERLLKLRSVLELACDKEMASELRSIFSSSINESQPDVSSPSRRTPTTHERIVEFFHTRNNEPATIKQITEGLDASKDAIRQVLYKSNRDYYGKRDAENGIEKIFWLKEPVANEKASPWITEEKEVRHDHD